MNEFEWRRQLRDINQPVAPERDLWSRIDAALDMSAQSTTDTATQLEKASWQSWALAASFAAIVLLAGGIAWRLQSTMTTVQAVAMAVPTKPQVWKPADPRFAGAAIELDAARMELQQAMQQAPDSPALQRLLERTDQQQSRLRQLDKQSG